ncbi:immunoglobulin domain-containing protein [Spirosoma rhododendri]|uniref:immunoglobulin domain-containing protein n=1 Tax=Spirosoma rhododendri TaxID=2728024 RepID=UPI0038CD9BB7
MTPSTSTTGTTTYYVTQTNTNGCESARSPLTVTINPTPLAPAVANTSVAYCQNTTAQPLQATATSGNTLNWYNSQGAALGSTAPTPSTTNPGTTFYQVSQRNASGCESPRVQITVTINTAPPPRPPARSMCVKGGQRCRWSAV